MQRFLLLCLIPALTACQLKLDGAACPCADGWVCCADRQVCVQDGTTCETASGQTDAGTGAGTDGNTDTGTDGNTDTGFQRLDLAGARANDYLGWAVAASGDLVAVGAPGRDSAASDAGAVELYERRGSGTGIWVRLGEIVAPDPEANAGFGTALAFANDQLVVGAPGAGSGKVYVYRRGVDGWAWSQTIEADLTGVPASQIAALGFGSDLAADQDRVVIADAARATAHVYQLSDVTSVHLATLDTPSADSAPTVRVAIHGTVVALAATVGNKPGFELDVFDAAHDWAGTEITEVEVEPLLLRVAFDGDRLAVTAGGKLRISERTDAGWSTAEAIDLGRMYATSLVWRGADLMMTAHHVLATTSFSFFLHTVQRIAGSWQFDAGTVLPAEDAGYVLNALAISGDWIAIGTPSSPSAAVEAGEVDFMRLDGSTVAETRAITLDEDGFASSLTVGDGHILATNNRLGPQAYWFDRPSDGAFHRRPSLVTGPDSLIDTMLVSGNHALIVSHAALDSFDITVQSYELGSTDWTPGNLLTTPDPGLTMFPDSIALSGDTALVSGLGADSLHSVVFVYAWSTAGWALSSQLTWTGPPCAFARLYLDGGRAILQCFDESRPRMMVFRRDGSAWRETVAPSFPDPDTSPALLLSGDRIAIKSSSAVNGHPVEKSYVFRWTGDTWNLEHSEVSDAPSNCMNGCERGIIALDGDRCVVATGPTSVTGERFVDGAWTTDREFTLPASIRSAATAISAATLMGDQLYLAVPQEYVGAELATGAIYVYRWPR